MITELCTKLWIAAAIIVITLIGAQTFARAAEMPTTALPAIEY